MISPLECAAMNRMRHSLFFIPALGVLLSACGSLIIPHDDKPAYEQSRERGVNAPSRAPLDVPPELRDEVSVPMPDKVAVNEQGAVIDKSVAGKAVSLDARVYGVTVDRVFSAVIDAMTALNLPVQSVDSPSGTITTEWIRQDANNQNFGAATLGGFFGGAGETLAVRHRFVVRVLRLKETGKAQLEIRTLGQGFINRHWVNRPLKRKVSEELFSSVEEQLARTAPKKAEQGATIRP